MQKNLRFFGTQCRVHSLSEFLPFKRDAQLLYTSKQPEVRQLLP